MVLKKSKYGYYTGNTVRKKQIELFRKRMSGKGTSISNLRYYNGAPSFDQVLNTLNHKRILLQESTDSKSYKSFDILTIQHIIEYFAEVNREISEGLFDRCYIPTTAEDYVDELVEQIRILIFYQDDIQNGVLDLGLGRQNGVQISVTVYEYGDHTDVGRTRYSFDTNKPHNLLSIEDEKRKKETIKKTSHNQRNRDDAQRIQNVTKRRIYEPDFEYPDGSEIAITIIKNDFNFKSALKFVTSASNVDEKPAKGHKSLKKSKHQKVKQYGHHNKLDKTDINYVVDAIMSSRDSYRRRKQHRLKKAERRYRRKGKVPPWLTQSNFPIPVGLWPDDVARVEAEREKRKPALSKETKAHLGKKVVKPKAHKIKAQNEAFLTEEAFINSKVENIQTKKINQTENKSRHARITRLLDIWEFTDELLHHIKDEQKIFLTDCTSVGKEMFMPHPPPHKPHSENRKHSVSDSQNESVIDFSLFEVNSVVTAEGNKTEKSSQMEYQTEKYDAVKSVLDSCNNQNDAINPEINQKKHKKKNGRKRKKEKLKLVPKNVDSDIPVSPVKEETKLSVSKEERILQTPAPKMIHTSGNTKSFIENFSDFRYTGLELKLKSSNLKPSYLVRKYGNNYQEASVFPRVFSIDVTDKLMEVFKLFRRTEDPFCMPFASVVVQLHHSGSEEIASANNLSFTVARLLLKADMEMASYEDLYLRMKEKLKYHLIYPLTKVVEDFVQVYKTLPYSSFMMPKIIPSPSLKVTERVRSQLDWLYTLCQWKFDIHPALEAYTLFSQTFQAFNIPRPTTSSLCRIIDSTPNISLRSCDMPGCYHSPYTQFLSCQHCLCKQCLQDSILQDMCNKQVPLSCWVPGCKTVIDPVCLLFLMSLPLYKLQQVYLEDKRIESHPLWQWCPRTGCGRVVKLSGAGFLDNGVVIVCDCGEVWCFHCRQEGHWPASCDQASNYTFLRKQDLIEPYKAMNVVKCPVRKILCNKCAAGAGDYSVDNNITVNNETESNEHFSLADKPCECQYEVCKQCVDTADSAIAIPKALTDAEGLTPSSSKSLLLPLLYYKNALLHRKEKELWSWSNTEIRTSKILQQIKRSKTRVASSYSHSGLVPTEDTTTCSYLSIMEDRDSSMGGSPLMPEKSMLHLPKARSAFRPKTGFTTLPSTGDTEKFFINTLQQFVQQVHVLLEYVYVYLMNPESSKKVPNVIPLVSKLESISKQINEILCTLRFSVTSYLMKLQKLLEAGNKIVVAITTTFKHTNVHGVSKQPTFFKTDFTKLPPIGQKLVQFSGVKGREPTY